MSNEKKTKKKENNLEAEIMADLDDLDKQIDDSLEDVDEIEEEMEEETNKDIGEYSEEENDENWIDEEGNEPASDNESGIENDELLSPEKIPELEIEEEENLDEEDEEDEEGEEDDIPEIHSNLELAASDQIDEHSQKKNVVEGALFIAGRPVSIEELNIKTELKKKELEDLLAELTMDYLERSTALEIVQIQDKFSLQIKPEYTPNVKKFASGGLIPDKDLKTLTIIALKQPILKSTLIKIRGAGAYEHVKFLEDRGFIQLAKKGRSQEIVTTDQFSDTFGLSRDIQTLKKQMITQLGINEQSTKNEE